MNQEKRLGQAGEKIAAAYLKSKGYRILKTNLNLKIGEVDILAQKKDTLVLVEVKTKSNLDFGLPSEMVTAKKKHKLNQLAQVLCFQYPNIDIRLDIIAIDYSKSQPEIDHLENVFF